MNYAKILSKEIINVFFLVDKKIMQEENIDYSAIVKSLRGIER